MPRTGRPSIFTPKDGERSYHILSLTTLGARLFELARGKLKRIAQWPGAVSDADTIEFLLRGEPATRAYLAKKNAAAKE